MLYLFRYRKIIILVTSLLLFSTIALYTNLIFQNNFENYDNLKRFRYRTIPNIVHYILFDQYEINFVTYLSMLSSIKNQKPKFLFVHSNLEKLNGTYWNKILNLNSTKTVIEIKYLARPSHVYGQELSSVFHASDVARIIVLQRWGGIYLDYDVLILKNLEPFMYYEMVVGWPEKEYMGTQLLLGNKNARFLSAWLRGYQRYNPTSWYYNAGHFPTEQILEKNPQFAHRVKKLFGVQNLLDYLYNTYDDTKWKEYFAVHLLSRHFPATKFVNEKEIPEANNTFGEIARFILTEK